MIRLALLGLLLPSLAVAQPIRITVPITQTTLPDDDIRYSVPVAIGDSPPIAALLDTGSTGLHVFAGAIPADAVTDTGIPNISAYGSGEQLTGTVATATIGLGAATTDGPIPLELVRSIGCMDFAPTCPAANLAMTSYGIGGDGLAGQGFKAIIGLGLAPEAGAANPLIHLGAHRWIIELPEPGQSAPGALILNPAPADLAGFQLFPLAAIPTTPQSAIDPGWQDTLAGCLTDQPAAQTICGPTILDTGSPGIIAYRPNGVSAPLWSPGDSTQLAFTIPGTAAGAALTFAADQFPGAGMIQSPAEGQTAALVAGVLPFFADDVLYDANTGEIGLRPRPDAPDFLAAPTTANPETTIEVIQMSAPTAPRLSTTRQAPDPTGIVTQIPQPSPQPPSSPPPQLPQVITP